MSDVLFVRLSGVEVPQSMAHKVQHTVCHFEERDSSDSEQAKQITLVAHTQNVALWMRFLLRRNDKKAE